MSANRRAASGVINTSSGVRKRQRELTQEERDAFEQFGLQSFEQEYVKLRKLTMAEDFSSSRSAYALLRAQMATVIRALRVMDRSFKESGGRNAYSYVAMHGLARELSHDLRAFGDQHELSERIRKDVVQGVLQSLATEVVAKLISRRNALHVKLGANSSKLVDDALRNLQEELTEVFASADLRAGELLVKALESR